MKTMIKNATVPGGSSAWKNLYTSLMVTGRRWAASHLSPLTSHGLARGLPLQYPLASYLLLLLTSYLPAQAQVGTWRAYMSYYEPQQIVKAGNNLFVRASNGLYLYNMGDQSVTTYDKMRQLSDTYITHIGWNEEKQKLVIAYYNSNIDLLDLNGNVTNISSLYARSMTQDKTINHISMYSRFAYLATGFGVVKLNVNKAEITESYILNENILSIAIDGDSIFALKADKKAYAASLKKNLLDMKNWTVITPRQELFTEDLTDWNQYLETVKTLSPDGPKYNNFNYMRFVNRKLYTCGGGWRDGGQFRRPFCAQILGEDKGWEFYDKDNTTPFNGTRLWDATSIAYDPSDPNHIFISSCGSGLYEFQDGQLVMNHTEGNSPLLSAVNGNYDYVRVDGLVFDNNRRLWMTVSSEYANNNSLVCYDLNSKQWKTFNNPELYDIDGKILKIMRGSILANDGSIWFCNDHHAYPALLRLDPESETVTRYNNFVNQDGTKSIIDYIRCVAQDAQGNIWIGTNIGLFMYDSSQIADPDQGFTQVKVPRNDGSNYADYLMSGVSITTIAIDGGNRKWIGTDGNGIYLISSDNMEQIHHFTVEDSYLLSNNVESIAVNHETGEVFIATDLGLCSYMGDATAPRVDIEKDQVYAYPNPVVSTYNGLITVVGLSDNADVKIITANGQLVAQGRSNGGMFTWNGRDSQGRRVASGVYMVAAATSDGKKGTVCKIAVVR